jgi:hypothetical protein
MKIVVGANVRLIPLPPSFSGERESRDGGVQGEGGKGGQEGSPRAVDLSYSELATELSMCGELGALHDEVNETCRGTC